MATERLSPTRKCKFINVSRTGQCRNDAAPGSDHCSFHQAFEPNKHRLGVPNRGHRLTFGVTSELLEWLRREPAEAEMSKDNFIFLLVEREMKRDLERKDEG